MTIKNETLQTLKELLNNTSYDITLLSNFSAFFFEKLEQVNWVGFYMNKNRTLKLGPFQGKVACIEIPFSKGVCGCCAREKQTILVPNVHEFEGHIICDTASNSEICIPILIQEELYAVLDIDSPILNRFTKEEQVLLEQAVQILTHEIEKIL